MSKRERQRLVLMLVGCQRERERQVSTKHIRCKSKAYFIGAQEKKEAEADLREPNVRDNFGKNG